ncbi:FAD-binding protein [Streptomyces sp. NPDC101227]|uniref:FAD-binding protein n=1 Tax=Streptomyces sp. NPDC101227 TaxID=3366136 RepID=UPI00382D9B9E
MHAPVTHWDAETDLCVVGFGAAGASAALEATDAGADVLALDRFGGGGATALSGGVVYAGGGTAQQRAAGAVDTPDAMYAYLKAETQGVVSDALLRRFCADSAANLAWLEEKGAVFEGTLCPFKTSYPTDDYLLYHSGNEQFPPYRDAAPPAPRGHRTKAKGLASGKVLFGHLAAAARARGVTLVPRARARRLILDGDRVVGVEYAHLTGAAARAHRALSAPLGKGSNYYPQGLGPLVRAVRRLEARAATFTVRARRGVVLAAGGFAFNLRMLSEHAPQYLPGRPLGTIGDDGSGIRLGTSAGGATAHLDRVSAWRFFSPPASLGRGLLVDRAGRRICNEMLYGAAIGDHMVNRHDGHAYLVVDQAIWERAKKELRTQTVFFQKAQMGYLFALGHRKAATPAAAAARAGISPDGLARTLEAYNAAAREGRPDPLGKPAEYVQPLARGPYYVLDCSLGSSLFYPCPMITLGGLRVHDDSGQVQRPDGSVIDGLYAAGRSAVGVCSHSYVSGLSIADAVFSGRRAGAHAAAR